ncbi:MAG: zinc ribbon domain-containing protein, partial [Chloroflexi bacterium]
MSVSSTHSCSRCGTAVPANMAFCSNCGAPLDTGAARPGNSAHKGADFQFVPPPPPGPYTPPTVY